MKLLFLLFVVLPIAEIMLLIEVGSNIGTLNTAALVVLTALVGSVMLRQQGLSTLFRAREQIDRGALPLQEMIEGICLAVGGTLLITPGFITDFIGFACLIPITRQWLVKAVVSRVSMSSAFTVHAGMRRGDYQAEDIIEGEFESDDDDRKKLK